MWWCGSDVLLCCTLCVCVSLCVCGVVCLALVGTLLLLLVLVLLLWLITVCRMYVDAWVRPTHRRVAGSSYAYMSASCRGVLTPGGIENRGERVCRPQPALLGSLVEALASAVRRGAVRGCVC